MKKLLPLLLLTPISANAECTPTPDCADMGYTETSCSGSFVRCPFDTSKLFCTPCDSSFQYTCDATNEYGDGASCNNKYQACCNTDCTVGALYYSDGTCSSCLKSTIMPVGVVIKDNEIIMNTQQVTMPWGGYGTDISSLSNNYSASDARSNYSGSQNTTSIVNQFGANANISQYAGVYCYNYTPTGLENSKGSWYLPAAGELYDYVFQNYNTISKTFINKLNWSSFDYYLWSSSEGHEACAWVVHMSNGTTTTPDKNHIHSTICLLKI